MTNGFKSGPGDDPFAEETAEESTDETNNEGDTARESAGESVRPDVSETVADEKPPLPWIMERDSVKDGRPKTAEFRMQLETFTKHRKFKAAVETELDENVSSIDLREAAYLVAMNHVDEVAEQLEEWGYNY